ncbi:hypothetical protein [Candidatus Uabimicrobium amorphum]|uniref:Uncharacterized protein n=1 Tax=Uabimicrobium amorphum TaxID=2596890 RepID=A0A5S9IKE4_UABAM|nr:hypothetical protein [Candidatus Uabimicrobium amorphum]BBM82215.1 hypothetical protein UABAM_00558 [Candidatus Uabimicrobium amorphum]
MKKICLLCLLMCACVFHKHLSSKKNKPLKDNEIKVSLMWYKGYPKNVDTDPGEYSALKQIIIYTNPTPLFLSSMTKGNNNYLLAYFPGSEDAEKMGRIKSVKFLLKDESWELTPANINIDDMGNVSTGIFHVFTDHIANIKNVLAVRITTENNFTMITGENFDTFIQGFKKINSSETK